MVSNIWVETRVHLWPGVTIRAMLHDVKQESRGCVHNLGHFGWIEHCSYQGMRLDDHSLIRHHTANAGSSPDDFNSLIAVNTCYRELLATALWWQTRVPILLMKIKLRFLKEDLIHAIKAKVQLEKNNEYGWEDCKCTTNQWPLIHNSLNHLQRKIKYILHSWGVTSFHFERWPRTVELLAPAPALKPAPALASGQSAALGPILPCFSLAKHSLQAGNQPIREQEHWPQS